MIDKKRVMEALEVCSKGCRGEGCSYNEEACCDMMECITCVEVLTGDALELLKGTTAKAYYRDSNYLAPFCGNCNKRLELEIGTMRRPKYCSWCGCEVEW